MRATALAIKATAGTTSRASTGPDRLAEDEHAHVTASGSASVMRG
jgi:hypothetical protein